MKMITLNMTDDNYVLWYGLNGYGITCFYLGINILIFVVAIVAVLLNGIIIYILFGRDFREDVSCIFISHLALSDFLSAVLLFYNVIYNLIHFKHFYECAIRFGLVNGVFLNSSVILLSLTAERYAKILLPFKYASLITPEKAKYFMISSWVVCLVICQAPLFGWNQDTSEEYCRYFGVFTKNFLLIYCAIMYMMSFLVFLMYCHILCIAFKQNNKIRRADHRQINKRHTHIWWKPTKTAMIIVGINVVSWLPSGIFAVLVTTGHLNNLSLGQKGTILTYISSVIYLNCIANPLIYACKIKKVSRFLRKLFKVREHATFVTEYDLKPESGEQLLDKEVSCTLIR